MSNWSFLSDYFSWLSPNENTNDSSPKNEEKKISTNVNKSKNIGINNNTKRVKKYNPNIKSQENFTNENNTYKNEKGYQDQDQDQDQDQNKTQDKTEDPLGIEKDGNIINNNKIIANEEKEMDSKKTKKEGGLLNQLGIASWLSSYDLSAMNDYKKGYYLDEEAKNVLPKKNTKKSNVIKIDANGNPEFTDNSFINNENKIVVDTTYYDSLNVSPTAKLNEIKNSYYKLALKYHPDKNKEDPKAKVKFQEISEAYQVLSDEGRRAKYDRYGVKATKDMILIDPSIFFMMLFSSEELIGYTGTLRIASFVQMAFEGNMAIEDKKSSNEALINELETEQTIREIQLALLLRKRLEPYVQNDETWVDNMENEIKNLLESSFSSSILESIGWTYENVATSFIAEVTTLWGVGATVANIQAASRTIGNTFCAAKSVINTVVTIKDMSGKHEKRSSFKMGEVITNTQNNQHLKDSSQNDNKNQYNTRDNAKTYGNATTTNKERKDGNDINTDYRKEDDNDYEKKDSSDTDENLMNVKSFGKDENKALGSIIKNVLTLVLWDIESTVRQAATKVVRDEEVDIHKRLKRAEGMKLLGQLMQKWARTKKDAGDIDGNEEIDATKLLENALIKAAQMTGDEKA